MAELEYAHASEACLARVGGSNPLVPTKSNFDFPASYPPPPYTGPAAQLLCFFNNGTKPLLSGSILAYGLDNSITIYFDNNADCTLGVVEITQKKDNTNTLFPNPIDETSKIALPYNIPSGKITVCNDIGQTIFSNSFQNKEDILIGDKIHTPGMYFYLVIDNQSGSVFSGKFICR